MLRSFSELHRTGWPLVALAMLTILFGYGQNHLGNTGGHIALPKLLWLMTAIWAWYIQPILLLTDARVEGVARLGVKALLVLMGIRAVVEGVMLYGTHNWSPVYGIVFNVCVMLLLGWVAWRIQGILAMHMLALLLMFVPECGFALYMKIQFITDGDTPIYFVPDDPRYQLILRFTWAAVLAAWAWQSYFLRYWLWPR